MHAISSYRGITDPQTHPQTHKYTHTHTYTNPQTGPITIHCAAKLSAQCNKAYNAAITLISVQLFASIKWLLPVLRLTELTMTGNSLRLAGKILVLVKLMALTIYAKPGLLRPMPQILALGPGQLD